MLSRWETDRQFAARALALKAETRAVTPAHSAAEAAVSAMDDEETARRRRDRIQHEVDLYLHEDDIPEVAHADLPKALTRLGILPRGIRRCGWYTRSSSAGGLSRQVTLRSAPVMGRLARPCPFPRQPSRRG